MVGLEKSWAEMYHIGHLGFFQWVRRGGGGGR
ncbi:uncharacterized protein G2W53_028615 [Senna tora]|uniref:Uncharacterized protein n=1 Tax=Senna tora TaxID=362788 RepID=A0A834T3L8_9FABA|nr:uncharacterized protein G2W53_028615 [Senna tora]